MFTYDLNTEIECTEDKSCYLEIKKERTRVGLGAAHLEQGFKFPPKLLIRREC